MGVSKFFNHHDAFWMHSQIKIKITKMNASLSTDYFHFTYITLAKDLKLYYIIKALQISYMISFVFDFEWL